MFFCSRASIAQSFRSKCGSKHVEPKCRWQHSPGGDATSWTADGAQLAVCEFHHSHFDILRQPLSGNSSTLPADTSAKSPKGQRLLRNAERRHPYFIFRSKLSRNVLGAPCERLFFSNGWTFFKDQRVVSPLRLSWMPVVVVPVVIRAPSVGFDVPPSVTVIPTIFPRFVQFVTRMFGLAAVPTVMFDRFVEVMICLFGSVLAFRLVGTDTRYAGEEQKLASAASVANFPYSSIPKLRSLCLRFSPVDL